MRRINKLKLLPSKRQKKLLKEMLILSSAVYNVANYNQRQRIINGEKILSYFALKQIVQMNENYQRLGRSYGSPMLQKYGEVTTARFRLIKSKSQKHVGLPKYYKNRKAGITIPSYLVIDGRQIKLDKKYVYLPLSRVFRKELGWKGLKVRYSGKLRYQGKTCRSEIHQEDGKFYLYQSVELPDVPERESGEAIGIDLGIKRLITGYTQTKKTLMIASKRWFRQYQYLTEKIASIKSELAKQNKRSSARLKRWYRSRTKYVKNLFSNVVAKLFRFLKRCGIKTLFIGDVKHIRTNTRHEKQPKLVKSMINNYWSYDKLLQRICSKAEEFGMVVKRTPEAYTTITCPECLTVNKQNVNDRQFHCVKCGYSDDRDFVGARNILSAGMHSQIKSVHWREIAPLEART